MSRRRTGPRRPLRWADVLDSLKKADLQEIQIQFPDYAFPSLVAAIEVSVKQLPEEIQKRYLDLAVFPEDTLIPECALTVIWGREGMEVRRIASQLVNRSLAARGASSCLGLHDLQVDYVRNEGVRKHTGKKRKLIPVRVAECALTGMLLARIYIDLVGLKEQDAERALLDGLKPSGRPAQPPQFPGKRAESGISSASFPPNIAKLHGVPELPPHYLPREEDLAELKRKLLAGVESVAITGRGQAVGVQGMGGIGKTVLAAALARDSEVRLAFPDGIWVGEKRPEKLPPEAAEVAKECGYLPLALAMIGAMIRLRPTAWKDVLDCLRASGLGGNQTRISRLPLPKPS